MAESWREAEETDTSDEEVRERVAEMRLCDVSLSLSLSVQEVRNTVGNIPLEWYEDYPHLGYDLDGKRISKPARRDEVGHTPLLKH